MSKRNFAYSLMMQCLQRACTSVVLYALKICSCQTFFFSLSNVRVIYGNLL